MTPAPAPLAPACPLARRRPPRPKLPPRHIDLTIKLPPAVASLARFRAAFAGETLDAFVLESVLRRFD